MRTYFLDFPGRYGSSHQRCSVRKGVLRNLAKFTGKDLCQSLFFNKVSGLRPATLLKKRLWHRYFPVNFVKFLRISFLRNTSGRLLLVCKNGWYTCNHIIFPHPISCKWSIYISGFLTSAGIIEIDHWPEKGLKIFQIPRTSFVKNAVFNIISINRRSLTYNCPWHVITVKRRRHFCRTFL